MSTKLKQQAEIVSESKTNNTNQSVDIQNKARDHSCTSSLLITRDNVLMMDHDKLSSKNGVGDGLSENKATSVEGVVPNDETKGKPLPDSSPPRTAWRSGSGSIISSIEKKKERSSSINSTTPSSSSYGSPRLVTPASPPVAWGGNWASRITEAPADATSPLNSLVEMFPLINREVVGAVLGMHRYNMAETIEYFLTQMAFVEHNLFVTSDATQSANQGNLLCSVPHDAFFKICDYLDWYHLPILSRVSRACRQLAVRSDVSSLICTRFRGWKDWRLLGLIAACRNLTSLSLRKCSNFTSFINLPSVVSPSLTSLNLSECKVTTRDIQHLLGFLPGLLSLDLSHGPISDDALEPIWTKGKRIQRLLLMACKGITCAGVGFLVARMPQLKELDVRATGITNSSTIFQGRGLESLNCSQCSRLTTLVVNASFNHLTICAMPHLVSLTLHGSVRSLNVSSCRNLLHLVVDEASSLRELNLSGCTLLKDLVLKRTEQRVWEMENLNLFQCRSLSPENLRRIFQLVGPSLQVLNGGGLIQLEDDVLDSIVSCCVRLVWLELPVPKRGLSRVSVQTAQEVVVARNRAQEDANESNSQAHVHASSSTLSSPPFSPQQSPLSLLASSAFSTVTPSRGSIPFVALRNVTPVRSERQASPSNTPLVTPVMLDNVRTLVTSPLPLSLPLPITSSPPSVPASTPAGTATLLSDVSDLPVESLPPASSESTTEDKSSGDKSPSKKASAWARKTNDRRIRRLQKKLCFNLQQNPGFMKPTRKSRSGAVYLKIPPSRQRPTSVFTSRAYM